MKKIILLFVLLFSLITFHCIAQQQSWNWYFGTGAAINFSSGNPVAVTGCGMNQAEGCATISDVGGNLLFYTDGVTVWNANNVVMANGNGLAGGASSNSNQASTQSAIIVPKPDSAGIYYIFTSAANTASVGICYSEVDMSLNAGMGGVTLKNHSTFNPACEKLVAVKHCNGIDYWVLAHNWNSNGYYAYLITNSGVATPVITNVGSNATIFDNEGYLKASPNGKKLACAFEANGIVELYDFDNATGIPYNPITIQMTAGYYPYGLSFSPDNTKVYVTCNYPYYPLYQFDISTYTYTAIVASQYTVTTPIFYGGALQLGADNKIYVAVTDSTYLNVINAPNTAGAGCSYTRHAIALSGTSRYGLPNFIDANLTSSPTASALNVDTSVCGGSVHLTASTISASYLWSSGATTQSVDVSNSGTYWVQHQVLNGCNALVNVADTFHVTITPPITVNLGNDTTICSPNSITLNANNVGSSYHWNTGETTQSITTMNAGHYWVQVNNGACVAGDSIIFTVLNFAPPHSAFTVDTLQGCKPLMIHLTNTSTGATSYWWHFSEGGTSMAVNPAHSYSHSGTYSVTLVAYDTTVCGVFTDTSMQTFYFTVFDPPTVPIITQLGDTLISSDTNGNQWFRNFIAIAGATNQQYIVTSTACYYVEYTDSNGCKSKSDSICFSFDGINEIGRDNSINIYPNPNNGTFTFNSQLSILNFQLAITNVFGQVVYSTTIKNADGKETFSIPLANGIYFLNIKYRNRSYNQKLLVNH